MEHEENGQSKAKCLYLNLAGWDKLGDGFELYEQTRTAWRLNVERAELADYVMAVRAGTVVEVFEPKAWLPAGSTLRKFRDELQTEDRYEFVGKLADESIRNEFRGQSVDFFPPGAENPVHYDY